MMASESSPPRSSGESVCAACHVSPLRTRTYRAAAERVRLPAATPERGCSTTIAVCAVRQCARAQRGPAPRMPMVWPIGPADRSTCGAAKASASSANARHSPRRIAGSPTRVAPAQPANVSKPVYTDLARVTASVGTRAGTASSDQKRTVTGHAPRSTANWRRPHLCTSQRCAWRRGLISRRRSAARSW